MTTNFDVPHNHTPTNFFWYIQTLLLTISTFHKAFNCLCNYGRLNPRENNFHFFFFFSIDPVAVG